MTSVGSAGGKMVRHPRALHQAVNVLANGLVQYAAVVAERSGSNIACVRVRVRVRVALGAPLVVRASGLVQSMNDAALELGACSRDFQKPTPSWPAGQLPCAVRAVSC